MTENTHNMSDQADPILPSILFWSCLFFAVGLFAAVLLSPKLLLVHQLESEENTLKQKLEDIKQRNRFLASVGNALESDPEFTFEVARFEMNVSESEEQPIEVKPVFPETANTVQLSTPKRRLEWWLQPARLIARDRTLSDICLATAAILIIVAFALFTPRHPSNPDLPLTEIPDDDL